MTDKVFSSLSLMEEDELKSTITILADCVGIEIPDSSVAMVGMHLKIAAGMAEQIDKVTLEPDTLELASVFNPLDFEPFHSDPETKAG